MQRLVLHYPLHVGYYGNNLLKDVRIMITATKPNVSLDGRYTVTQTCKALGIHRNTLARYTASHAIKCSYRKADHRKVYTGENIIRLWKSQL